MKITTLQKCCFVACLGLISIAGCQGNTGMVTPPETSAEEQAAIEARQAEYSKSMQESYGKK